MQEKKKLFIANLFLNFDSFKETAVNLPLPFRLLSNVKALVLVHLWKQMWLIKPV